MIDVVQEKVERGDALGQAALDQVPFARRDDARDQVERENPLRSLVVVVDREGDALTGENWPRPGRACVQNPPLPFP